MNTTEMPASLKNNGPDATRDAIREQVLEYSKDFKTSWVNLGRHLFAIWDAKMYHGWGFEKFEHYTEREIGISKSLSLKLLKTYFFLEQEEPAYLKEDFAEDRDASKVPGYDEINVLRLARQKKELVKDDYREIKSAVFDKGKTAAAVRKDLTAMMKERKVVDPEEERDLRNEKAIRSLVNSIRSFKRDMASLQLIPDDIVEEAKSLMQKLEHQLAQAKK